ncbi:MAG: DUF5687 family protein [Bacteroidaceae bacterium]|nr:DUF5687 family protein [Bacteroidaceae bacterium]
MTSKEVWSLFRLINKNKNLAAKRHPMFEKNRAMKVFTYIFIAFWACYLIFFGFLFANVIEDGKTEPYDVINGGLIIFLMIDFVTRFGMQETPAQEIRPYKLLPIPEDFLHNVFLLRIGLCGYNFFWFFFFVPFGFVSVAMLPCYTLLNFLGYMLGIWLMFVLNAYWYLFWRTLINHHTAYWLIPIAVYAAMVFLGMMEGEWLMDFSRNLMRGCINGNVLSYLAILALIAICFFVNRCFQKRFVYYEIARVEKILKVKSSEMSFLNRFGEVGEYLKLELKSIRRNAVVRKQFITGIICTVMLCSLFAFTDAYDNQPFMRSFVCVYCFSALGVITLTSVMGAEGNYIDGLMSRKESVLSLLKAKYYFNCMMMILPILFCIMPLAEGKMTIYEALGCFFFSMGVIFPFLFQLAVYNDTTVHLNEKMTRGGKSTKAQIIVSLVALFFPMGLMYILMIVLDAMMAGIIMAAIGLVGTIAHPLWLKNIYKRFMNRRYENMAGFRATR